MTKILKSLLLTSLLLISHHTQTVLVPTSHNNFSHIDLPGDSFIRIGSHEYSLIETVLALYCLAGAGLVLILTYWVYSYGNKHSTKEIIPSIKLKTKKIKLNKKSITLIKISGLGKLIIKQAIDNDQKERCIITAPKNILKYLNISTADGVLHIYPKPNITFSSIPVITYILTLKNIMNIYLSGRINAKTDTSIQTHISSNELVLNIHGASSLRMPLCVEKLTVNASGTSKALLEGLVSNHLMLTTSGTCITDITVETTKLDANLSGSSHVTLKGQSTNQIINSSGCSVYNAANCTTQAAHITTSGTAKAIVCATQRFKYQATGVSSISYKGNPQIEGFIKSLATINHIP